MLEEFSRPPKFYPNDIEDSAEIIPVWYKCG